MNIPDTKFIKFIKRHHVLSLATSVDNRPWCANCFYAFSEDELMFVFTSDLETKHASDASKNRFVAGTVVLETSVIGKIQGLQFTGMMYVPEGEWLKRAHSAYMKRFPFAALMETHLWVLEPDYMKLTDNRLGFGKKLIWKKEDGKV
jgi:uncharacterized protein YhbP (UPF0306 family)